jgi:hypothetical protein
VHRRYIPVIAVILLFASASFAQTQQRESLRGLHGVYVYIHPVDKDVQAGGLSTSQIQKAVQTQLREAGILLQDEPQPADGSANLVVTIDTVKTQGVYLYEVEVVLLQEVHLARRQIPDPFPAQTWGTKVIGLTSANRMDMILEPLKSTVAGFIADYSAVNAKPQPPA